MGESFATNCAVMLTWLPAVVIEGPGCLLSKVRRESTGIHTTSLSWGKSVTHAVAWITDLVGTVAGAAATELYDS